MKPSSSARSNVRAWTAVAVSAAFFVPLLAFGGPALARSASAASEYQYSGSSQYQYKITVCHKTHSRKHPWVQIRVSVHAWKAHARHGDILGTCPPPAAPTSSTSHHGKSGDHHGKGDSEHGNSSTQHGNSGGDHGKSGGSHGNSGH